MTTLFEKLPEAVRNLDSDDPETFLSAIETVSSAPKELARLFVRQLARPDGTGAYLVFERTARFGNLAIEPLRAMLADPDEAVRTIAGVTLLWCEDRQGEDAALRAVRWDHDWMLTAVRGLRRAGSERGIDLMRAALLEPRLTHEYVFGGLLEEWCARGLSVDNAIRKRIEDIRAPEYLKTQWMGLCGLDPAG